MRVGEDLLSSIELRFDAAIPVSLDNAINESFFFFLYALIWAPKSISNDFMSVLSSSHHDLNQHLT